MNNFDVDSVGWALRTPNPYRVNNHEARLAALEAQVAELTRRLNDVTVSKYAPVYTLNTRRNA